MNIISSNLKKILPNLLIPLILIALSSCGTGGDARKNPPQPELRVKKNLEEGKGFRLDNALRVARVKVVISCLRALTNSGGLHLTL